MSESVPSQDRNAQPYDEEALFDKLKKLTPEQFADIRRLINVLERSGAAEKPPRPTAEDLASVTVDIKIALYIVGQLAINDNLPLKPWSSVDSEGADLLMYIVDDIREAIREAIKWVDFTELEWLKKANFVERSHA